MLVNTTIQGTVSQRLVWIRCKPVCAAKPFVLLAHGNSCYFVTRLERIRPLLSFPPGLWNHLTRALESQPDFEYFIASQFTVQTRSLKHGTGANSTIHLMCRNVTPPPVYSIPHPSWNRLSVSTNEERSVPTQWNSPDVPGWITHLSCVSSVFWVPQTEIWMNKKFNIWEWSPRTVTLIDMPLGAGGESRATERGSQEVTSQERGTLHREVFPMCKC